LDEGELKALPPSLTELCLLKAFFYPSSIQWLPSTLTSLWFNCYNEYRPWTDHHLKELMAHLPLQKMLKVENHFLFTGCFLPQDLLDFDESCIKSSSKCLQTFISSLVELHSTIRIQSDFLIPSYPSNSSTIASKTSIASSRSHRICWSWSCRFNAQRKICTSNNFPEPRHL
jgi:hypothetical protein